MQYYSVKEVCELTGLTRKILFDYDHNGIVKPTNYYNHGTDKSKGYKLYDMDALIKLQQAAIYRKLHLKRSEIKNKLTSPDYDCNVILDEQINMLKKEKEDIEKLIETAEYMKNIGVKSPYSLSYFANINFNDMIHSIENWKNSKEYIQMTNRIANIPQENIVECVTVLEEVTQLSKVEIGTEKSDEIIKRFMSTIINKCGIDAFIIVILLATLVQSKGNYEKKILQNINDKLWENIKNSFEHYFIQCMNEFCNIFKKYKDVVGMDCQNPKVKEMVNELKNVFEIYTGISQKNEYKKIYELILQCNVPKQIKQITKVQEIEYIIDVFKLYCVEENSL